MSASGHARSRSRSPRRCRRRTQGRPDTATRGLIRAIGRWGQIARPQGAACAGCGRDSRACVQREDTALPRHGVRDDALTLGITRADIGGPCQLRTGREGCVFRAETRGVRPLAPFGTIDLGRQADGQALIFGLSGAGLFDAGAQDSAQILAHPRKDDLAFRAGRQKDQTGQTCDPPCPVQRCCFHARLAFPAAMAIPCRIDPFGPFSVTGSAGAIR